MTKYEDYPNSCAIDISICKTCGSLVRTTAKDKAVHESWHEETKGTWESVKLALDVMTRNFTKVFQVLDSWEKRFNKD